MSAPRPPITGKKGASGSPLGPKSVVFVPHPKASPPVAAGVRRSPAADELPVSSRPVRAAGGQLIWMLPLMALVALSACDDLAEPGTSGEQADASQQVDTWLDTTPEPDLPAALPGCNSDVHCELQNMVCDKETRECVECNTDQECPQPKFCLDHVCVPDVCTPGDTRCDAPTVVSMCKANGSGWFESPCGKETFCSEGTCLPLNCDPDALDCDGAQVVRCDKWGIDWVLDEDCAAKDMICKGSKCMSKGCKLGEIACAGPTTALICKDPKKGFEVQDCKDTDPCTTDTCTPGTGCGNQAKVNGMSCAQDKWCFEGQCTNVVNNLVVIFDTSGSMNQKVPGKSCKPTKWPECIDAHKSCNRIGVSKSVFIKALAHVDTSKTRLAMFRFPQITWSEDTPLPDGALWSAPPYPDCVHGYYMGYQAMTSHSVQEEVGPDSSWYWDRLDEILCVPFPTQEGTDPKAEVLKWMDGVETLNPTVKGQLASHDDPELRPVGWTPIGRTFFYVGEYLRNRVVIEGMACKADADCDNVNYTCVDGACHDPMHSCRKTTVVLFTDGGEINKATDFFAPWVQAKRLAYGLRCADSSDCVGGAVCVCSPDSPNCEPAERMCLPTDKGTGFYCESNMKACLPEADPGDDSFCATGGGLYSCQPDPIGTITAGAVEAAQNVLRTPDGKPFGVTIHVVDISGAANGPKKHSGNIARLGGGRLLSSNGVNEDAFLDSLRQAFDTGPKQGCGVKNMPCSGAAKVPTCDDANVCTNDSCNAKTGTCLHLSNTGPCADDDACTLSDRCFNGDCVADIAFVDTLAGDGGKQAEDGPAADAAFAEPLDVTVAPGGHIYISDRHLIRRLSDGAVTTWTGDAGAGYGDGDLAGAKFGSNLYLAAAANGDLWVSDTDHHRVRRVDGAGKVSTIAGQPKTGPLDGVGAAAQFNGPAGLTVVTAAGGAVVVYVADRMNNLIRQIDETGKVVTIAGSGLLGSVDGPALQGRVARPIDVAVGPGDTLYVAEPYRVRMLADGVLSTLSGVEPGFGNGPKKLALYNGLASLVVQPDGSVYASDVLNRRVRTITTAGAGMTLAGGQKGGYIDGYGSVARFETPAGLALDPTGRLLIADTFNRRLRYIQTPRVICAASNPCNAIACDPTTGSCQSDAPPAGTACSTDPCVAGQTCQDLDCKGGTSLDCDDNDPCTDDACDADSAKCSHTANAAACDDGSACTLDDHCDQGGCQGTPMDCDDGDAETLDVCMYGVCVGKADFCTKDSTCDDGDDTCTVDTCVDNHCTYKHSGASGCCQPVAWANDFEAGKLNNISILNSLGPEKGWQIWLNDGGADPPLNALYYGDKSDGNFAFDGPSSGTVTTPPAILPPGLKSKLSFRLWMDTEGAVKYDVFKVEAVTKLGAQLIWQKGPAFQLKIWSPMSFDLSAWGGQAVSIRFSFDTRDHRYNDGLGIYLDKLAIEVACP